MYTRIYTDQEKWSVNHITYIVVYTLGGYVCDHKKEGCMYCDHKCNVSRIVTVCHIMLQYYDYGLTWGTECVKLYIEKLR